MGNPVSHGTANDENVIVQVTYDKAGRRVALRDPRGNQTTYAYDQLDRRTSLSNPLDQAWTTAYSDLSGGRRRVTRTNPLGQQVEEDYDRLGRLVAVRYLNETPKHTPDVVFRYDAAGNRVAMDETLDGGVTWLRKTQYGYDGVGRLVSVGFDTNGDGVVEATVTYQYDAGGRRTQMTLPGNRTVQYAYDVKGQLVSLTDWDGQVTRYRYDNAGRLREAQGANLLTRRWRYDAAGRLRHLRHSREGKTLGDFTYEVDKRGDRTQVRECLPQAAAGTTVLAHADLSIDYLRGTWAAVGDFHETTTMGAALRVEVFGTELTLVMGRGPDHSVYDLYLNGTLRDSLDGYTATPSERSLTYSLTDEGPHTVEVRNRTDKNLASSGYKLRFKSLTTNLRYDLHTIQYAYDKLERLHAADYRPTANLSAAPFRQHSYAYDVAGNRTQVNDNGAVTNYTYNAANQITNPGFSYDAVGRMTNDGVNTTTWDRADRLLSMGGVQNQYNGLGQRVQQSVGAQVTQYLLDTQPGLWQVLASTTGADTTRYVHGPTGIQQQQNPDNAWVYPAQDALGSVRSVADANMAVPESRHYEPYGEPWGVMGVPQTDFGFTGEPTDDNGLVHLRARHYNPAVGVFMGLDPLEGEAGRAMSLNRYGWVEGNVANKVDPTGMALETPDRYLCSEGNSAVQRCPDGSLGLFGLCCQIYAPLEARDYAIDHSVNPNTLEYIDYDSEPDPAEEISDCANFVSQAMRKGKHLMRFPGGYSGLQAVFAAGRINVLNNDDAFWACYRSNTATRCIGTRSWRAADVMAPYLRRFQWSTFKSDRVMLANNASSVRDLPMGEFGIAVRARLDEIRAEAAAVNAQRIGVGDIIYLEDTNPPHVVMIVGWGEAVLSWAEWTLSPKAYATDYFPDSVPYVVDRGGVHSNKEPRPYYLLRMTKPNRSEFMAGRQWEFIKVPPVACVPAGDTVILP